MSVASTPDAQPGLPRGLPGIGKVTGTYAPAERGMQVTVPHGVEPLPEAPPGLIRAFLGRVFGSEVRPPMMPSDAPMLRSNLGTPWISGNVHQTGGADLSGLHGVIGVNQAETPDGVQVPPAIYARPTWRRTIPQEWSASLVRS